MGSEREALAFNTAVTRTAVERSSTQPPTGYDYRDVRLAGNCAGIAERRRQPAGEVSTPPLAMPLAEIGFRAGGHTALQQAGEFVTCQGGAVWFLRHDAAARRLYLRRHDLQGSLQRAWHADLPAAPDDVSRHPEPETLREENGQVLLRMLEYQGTGAATSRRLVTFAFPA